tara:strand:- start:288 stop:1430 length:1143 start_codon:yes stop_codon:yes gene_type:complete
MKKLYFPPKFRVSKTRSSKNGINKDNAPKESYTEQKSTHQPILNNRASILRKKLGNFMNNFMNFFNSLKRTIIYVFVPVVRKVEAEYPTVLYVLYIIRFIFSIFIIAIVIWSSNSGGSGTETPLYHLYSILKSVFVILMLIAGSFVVSFAVKDADTREAGKKSPLRTEIAVLYSFLYLIPYMYDLIAIIILLGILKAYYIRGCNSGDVNKKPNVYNFIDIIVWGPVAIIFLTMISTIILRIKKISQKVQNSILTIITPLMSVSVAMLILYFAMQYLEEMVTNNIAYWMKLYDGATSDVDCVTDQIGTGTKRDGEGFEKAKNIIISVILGILVLVVCVIQLIPGFGLDKVNKQARDILKIGVDKTIYSLEYPNVTVRRDTR